MDKTKTRKRWIILLASGLAIFLVVRLLGPGIVRFFSTNEEDIITPKPRGYMRINFPKHKYKLYDSLCPFNFETPKYSWVLNNKDPNAQPCWLDVYYPRFGAILHLTYIPVSGNLEKYLEDSHQFANVHTVKASGLNENLILRDSAKVYGLWYDIGGNSASNLQFHLTDSTRHFIRGSLYFSVKPNIDSLQPVIDFLREDVIHMMKTFNWKDSEIKFDAPKLSPATKK
jgi:gliding motility-associated lipoprotein GldD